MTPKPLSCALIVAVSLFTPVAAFAASNGRTLGTVAVTVAGLLNTALFLIMAFALVAFVFFVVRYFIVSEANRAQAAPYVMYSLIGFFVILSFWGLVNILQNTFGLKNEDNRPASWTSFTNLFPSE